MNKNYALKSILKVVPIALLMLMGSVAYGQSTPDSEKLNQDRIAELERKIEANKNNPDFDYDAAVKMLQELKVNKSENSSIKPTPKSLNSSEVNFDSAKSSLSKNKSDSMSGEVEQEIKELEMKINSLEISKKNAQTQAEKDLISEKIKELELQIQEYRQYK